MLGGFLKNETIDFLSPQATQNFSGIRFFLVSAMFCDLASKRRILGRAKSTHISRHGLNFKRPKIVDGVRVKRENNRKWNITLLRSLRKNKIAFHAHLIFLTFIFSLYLHYRNNQSSVDHKLTESCRALVTETETKYIDHDYRETRRTPIVNKRNYFAFKQLSWCY